MKISNRTAVLILAGILLVSVAVAGILWRNRPEGTMVEVTVNGQLYGTYPLNEPRTVEIQPEDGSWHNILEIRDGEANMVEADCPDKLCVLFPPLTENELGVIYCAPHGVVVVLTQ